MKCITNGKKVLRVKECEAQKTVGHGDWQYCGKELWKAKKKEEEKQHNK